MTALKTGVKVVNSIVSGQQSAAPRCDPGIKGIHALPPPKKTEPVLGLDWQKHGRWQIMARKVFNPEQIINMLWEAEVVLSQGLIVSEARYLPG